MPEEVVGFGSTVRENRHRIGAALLATGLLVLLVVEGWSWPLLIVLGPAVAGAVLAAVANDALTGWVDRWERTFERLSVWSRSRQTKVAVYFGRPAAGGSRWLWNRTIGIGNGSTRSGVRLAFALYFWAIMIALLAAAAYIVIGIVCLFLMISVFAWFTGTRESESDDRERASRRGSSRLAPQPSGPTWSFFGEKECRHCHSKDHSSEDCPHDQGFLGIGAETACRHCGSKEHSAEDCPHEHGFLGIGAETACRHCGSKDHTSEDCVHDHGFLGIGAETACRHCGAVNHASEDCPHDHGFLGIGAEVSCNHCGSREHATVGCPHR